MITITKTYGVRDALNDETLIRLQEIIALAKEEYGMVGKAVIDAEKITFSKFYITLGYARHATHGLVINEQGIISYIGILEPKVYDRQILTDVYRLFGKRCTF